MAHIVRSVQSIDDRAKDTDINSVVVPFVQQDYPCLLYKMVKHKPSGKLVSDMTINPVKANDAKHEAELTKRGYGRHAVVNEVPDYLIDDTPAASNG